MKKLTILVLIIAGALCYALINDSDKDIEIKVPVVKIVAQEDETLIVPVIILDAQDECEVGELVTLDASASSAKTFIWQVIPETKNFVVIEDGARAFFSSSTSGEYLIILAGADDNRVGCVTHKLTVLGEPEILDPFTTLVKSWLPENSDPELLKALSRSFEESAKANDVESLIKATAVANRAVLGVNLDTYKPFLVAFSTYLRVEYQSKSFEEHQQLWRNIARILKSC